MNSKTARQLRKTLYHRNKLGEKRDMYRWWYGLPWTARTNERKAMKIFLDAIQARKDALANG